MELNEKQKELLRAMKKLPFESENIPNEKENDIICAILIGTNEGLLDNFISVANKSSDFQSAFNEMFKDFPELEPIDDELLTEEER